MIYGGNQDQYAERLETDISNVDLMTRLYNKNKTIVTSIDFFDSKSRRVRKK